MNLQSSSCFLFVGLFLSVSALTPEECQPLVTPLSLEDPSMVSPPLIPASTSRLALALRHSSSAQILGETLFAHHVLALALHLSKLESSISLEDK